MSRKDNGRAGKQNHWAGIIQSDTDFIHTRVEVILKTRCWEWLGSVSSDGYGKCKRGGKTYRAHRLSYEIFRGEIPKGHFICHHCDNPLCVNPEHLWAGTHKDNEDDKDKKGRRSPSPSTSHPHLLPKGEKHHGAKLTAEQVEEAYKYKLKNLMVKADDIITAFNLQCTASTLLQALSGKTWRHLKLVEKYGKIITPTGFSYINHHELVTGRPKTNNASGFIDNTTSKSEEEINLTGQKEYEQAIKVIAKIPIKE